MLSLWQLLFWLTFFTLGALKLPGKQLSLPTTRGLFFIDMCKTDSLFKSLQIDSMYVSRSEIGKEENSNDKDSQTRNVATNFPLAISQLSHKR